MVHAGPLLGLCIVGLRASVNKPYGALGGYIDLAEHASRPRELGMTACLLMGFVVGGAVHATMTGTFSPSLVYAGTVVPASGPASQLLVLLLAGFAIGFGARTAGGCTSGHGLTGMSVGSPASVVATVTFFTTAVLVAHVLAWL